MPSASSALTPFVPRTPCTSAPPSSPPSTSPPPWNSSPSTAAKPPPPNAKASASSAPPEPPVKLVRRLGRFRRLGDKPEKRPRLHQSGRRGRGEGNGCGRGRKDPVRCQSPSVAPCRGRPK